MTRGDRTAPSLHETGHYDPEYREFGDCAAQAIEQRPGMIALKHCELEVGHNGVHDWDPTYEYPDDDE